LQLDSWQGQAPTSSGAIDGAIDRHHGTGGEGRAANGVVHARSTGDRRPAEPYLTCPSPPPRTMDALI